MSLTCFGGDERSRKFLARCHIENFTGLFIDRPRVPLGYCTHHTRRVLRNWTRNAPAN